MLEHAQREPVFIGKSGRRHSVLISADWHDALLAAQHAPTQRRQAARDPGLAFYEKHKDWGDSNNALVECVGIPGEEFRLW